MSLCLGAAQRTLGAQKKRKKEGLGFGGCLASMHLRSQGGCANIAMRPGACYLVRVREIVV